MVWYVTSLCSTKMAKWIELIFGMEASFDPSYTVLLENSGNSSNKDSSIRNFVPNSVEFKISPRQVGRVGRR